MIIEESQAFAMANLWTLERVVDMAEVTEALSITKVWRNASPIFNNRERMRVMSRFEAVAVPA